MCSMGWKSENIHNLLGKIIFIALSAYLVLKIAESWQRFDHEGWNSHPKVAFCLTWRILCDLNKSKSYVTRRWTIIGCDMPEQMVSISSSVENAKLVKYPSISICAYRRSASQYFTNVAPPWSQQPGSAGPSPDPNNILESLGYNAAINKSRFASIMIYSYMSYGWTTLSGLLLTYVHQHQSLSNLFGQKLGTP